FKSVIAFTQKFCFHVGPPIVKLETYTYIAELQAFLTEFYRSTTLGYKSKNDFFEEFWFIINSRT
ncbi:MAG: hypothetical protein PHH77_10705, partial [Victivallaceae bacterium]|nr:hypothetical protein [Victivallaceae bacterium]